MPSPPREEQHHILESLSRPVNIPSPTPKGANAKGADFELFVSKAITEAFGRTDNNKFSPRSPRSGARATPEWKGDISLVGDAVKLFPFLIECKNDDLWTLESFLSRPQKSTLYGYWLKIKREASNTNFHPALCFKRFGTPAFWMVERSVADLVLPLSWKHPVRLTMDLKVEAEQLTMMYFQEWLPLWVTYQQEMVPRPTL